MTTEVPADEGAVLTPLPGVGRDHPPALHDTTPWPWPSPGASVAEAGEPQYEGHSHRHGDRTRAERLGTIKVRPEWCPQCAKEAKAAAAK